MILDSNFEAVGAVRGYITVIAQYLRAPTEAMPLHSVAPAAPSVSR